MAQDHLTVYAFGDQTYDATGILSTLLNWDDVLVSDLVVRTTRRLQQEIAKLEPEQRAKTPKFATLLELVPQWKAGTLTPALCQALTCFAHIGAFVASHGVEAGSQPFPSSSNACLTGICTGLLSAAAVSHATNVGELVLLGSEAIAVAFRVGALAADVGSRIASCGAASWTAAIVGSNVDDVRTQVDGFDKHSPSAPYVSAVVSANQINVSGAPHTLQTFLSTLHASQQQQQQQQQQQEQAQQEVCVSTRLAVQAPYHAPHLYSERDVEQVLSSCAPAGTLLSSPSPTESIPVISSATGQVVSASTFVDALRSAARDCLLHVVLYPLLGRAIASRLRLMGEACELTIQPIAWGGPERLASAVRANLASACGPPPTCGESIETVLAQMLQQESICSASRSKIAVLSCSGRFPRASSMDQLWHILVNGIDTHQQVPASRWSASTHVATSTSSLGKNMSQTGYGCWLEDVAAFDAKFFNVSPREAPQMDPAQRIALMCATEALEGAGIVPGRTPSTQHNRIGVYFGVTSNDWMETNSAQNIDTYFIPGGNRAFIAGRINYHFKFSGPSYSIDTACSSSLTAVQLACNALWRKEIDVAVVGGTNILTNPDMHCGLDRGHFLSRTGNCKTFDASADGYCRGEAVAVVVLKRLEDAEKDLDPIQACILSVATNHSAEADSITRPHVHAQRELVDRVLREAGVCGSSISYAEMHGTGTQVGDVAETTSVVDSLAAPGQRKSHQPLYIGSAKANIGHGEAAAGVTSIAKVLLMLKHNTIPPHCGITTRINPKMPELTSRNTLIATEPIAWARPDRGLRRVLVNNFSAAGGNTALILEDGPLRSCSLPRYANTDHSVALSAKATVSLNRNVQAIIDWIDRQDVSDASLLPGLAYTTTARRSHHPHRLAVTGTNLQDVKSRLEAATDRISPNGCRGPPKILFAFAGQRGDFSRAAADLYKNLTNFQHDINGYDRMCLSMGLPSILALFVCSDSWESATPQVLQLAAVCLQMGLVRLWRSFGVHPTVVLGHSLGEYPALYAAGVLSQCDVIYLVGKRAALMQENCIAGSHAMLIARSSLASIEALLQPYGHRYEICCVNGPRNVVLGGTRAELKLVHAILEEHGIQTAELPLPYAFHTSQIDPVLDALDDLAGNVYWQKQKVPTISPTFAGVASELGSAFAVAHCRSPVQMYDAVESARAQGLFEEGMVSIEIGAAAVTSNMIKEVVGSSLEILVSMRQGQPVSRPLSTALARLYERGSNIDWNAYHHSFDQAAQVVQLPAYEWDSQDYWMSYKNDWSLRKGDPKPEASKSMPLSTTIHRVVVDTLRSQAGELILESDLNREDISTVVHGHKVYGISLCTPSVYADIALTIGQHLKEQVFVMANAVVEIIDMIVKSALVVLPCGKGQILQTKVKIDRWSKTALCTFSSLTGNADNGCDQHARCTVRFVDVASLCESATKSLTTVFPRMEMLSKRLGSPSGSETYRFSKSMIYKMVEVVAEFDAKYHGLVEVLMDNAAFEATGKVEFKDPQLFGGAFNVHPACIDALSQLGGFVMNANENTDLSSEIFVNHGWRSLQVFETIDPGKAYRSHVKMFEGNDKLWSGDVTIFNGDHLVARFGGIALQRVPRRLMECVVNAAYAKAASAQPTSLANAGVTRMAKELAPRCGANITSFGAVLAIISAESGIPLQELEDARSFDDLGVDSLLSLLIMSRIREELSISLEHSIFLELGSVGALRAHINALDALSGPDHLAALARPIIASKDTIWPSIVHIVSQEAGIPVEDLTDQVSIADLGVDSLLSLVISSRLQQELGIELPHVSLFLDCDTIGDLKARTTGLSSTACDKSDDAASFTAATNSPSQFSWAASEVSVPETPFTPLESMGSFELLFQKVETPTARSHTIQGNTRTVAQRLFLFPDGGGSATSYMNLPSISPSWAMVAFDSPFKESPHMMAMRTLPDLIEIYLTALRHHQSKGPYHLGGWSAGGILAYAIACELVAAGEQVASLILIDSPSPAWGLDRLPQSFFDHCSSIGIFESEMNERKVSQTTPRWLMPHFHATIDLLHTYYAAPLPGTGTTITIIWAGKSAFSTKGYSLPADGEASYSPSEMEGISFLTQQRTDFGVGKWKRLLAGHHVTCYTIDGEHHFSMMRRGAGELGKVMREALLGSTH